MNAISALRHSRHASLLGNAFMAGIWAVFAYAHVLAYLHTRDWSYLLFCMTETVSALFFLIRTAPDSVSTDMRDWLLAIAAALLGRRLRQVLKNAYHMLLGTLLQSLAGGPATVAEPPAVTGKLAYAFAIASGTGLQIFLTYNHLWSLR